MTFTGKEYFFFTDSRGDDILDGSFEEEINVDFKTSRSTGLLIYTGMLCLYLYYVIYIILCYTFKINNYLF